MSELDSITQKIIGALDAKNAAREQALTLSRKVIQQSALTIRASHRADYDEAARLLAAARDAARLMREGARVHPDLYYAGYVQDALKEFSEASIVNALVQGLPLPDPDVLGVEYAAYLNGMGEAAGELRRHALDLIRQGRARDAETTLQWMEDIFSVLVTVDYPDAITGGLRRTADMVRGVLERTRGDVTVMIKQEELKALLKISGGSAVPGGARE
ncbi:MAG: haloacid dehalogenase [Chloroflexi bacterium]|nr:haloacid dehalogenase [Chloroflexota bacterium]